MKNPALKNAPFARKQARLRTNLRLCSIALALAAMQTPAMAVDYIWQGGGGFWDDPTKWTLLGVPGSGDSANIPRNTGTETILIRDPRSLGQLYLNGGNLASTSTLTVSDLHFGNGYFGRSSAQSGGVMNVTGSAIFNGEYFQNISYSHVINLGANTNWTKGNGSLAVDPAYSQGMQTFASAVVNIGAGTVFSDAGAASDAGFRTIGGGDVNNFGTYVRTGLGTTVVRGFNNTGTLDIRGGDFSFDGRHFSNKSSGLIQVGTGSTLNLHNTSFSAGTIVNNGLIRQFGGEVDLGASVQIGGAWQIDQGALRVEGVHSIESLVFNGHRLTGTGVLNTKSLTFNYGTFTVDGADRLNTLNVTESAGFKGGGELNLGENHVLNLSGNSRWTAGNGQLTTAGSSSYGSQSTAATAFNIGAGTTFTDEGTLTAQDYKLLGGAGKLNNYGTFVRAGSGETVARGFHNFGKLVVASGTLTFDGGNFQNCSSGLIEVANGTTLNLANTSFTNGAVINKGLIRQFAGDVLIGASASIGGAWQVDRGALRIEGTHSVDSLAFNGNLLTGVGVLNTKSLNFNYGTFGVGGIDGLNTLNVSDSASFNGAGELNLGENHVLNLSGNSRWTVGNGRLTTSSSSSYGSQSTAATAFNMGAGTTFTDEGATSATSYKLLGGGGQVNNAGTYLRLGLGETYARGFKNTGTLQVIEGTMSVDDRFSNTGRVQISNGARLLSYYGQFTNAGEMTGNGQIKTLNANYALTNSGSINPGQDSSLGRLTIDGDLYMTEGSVLHIDLASGGLSDQLLITDEALWNGELSIWARPGTELHLGDVYTIASFGQRQANSTFNSISWHGLSADQFAVEYTNNNITLRVTAVPEPSCWVLMFSGLALFGWLSSRRRRLAEQ